MALTATDRGGSGRAGGTASQSSDTFTPSANSLVLAFVMAGTAGPDSISGHDGGSSWVQLGSTATVSSRVAELWGAFTGGSPSSGTITAAKAAAGSMGVVFCEVSGDVDVSGTVANSLTEVVQNTGYSASPNVSFVGTPTDLTLGFCAIRGGQVPTMAATELSALTYNYSDDNLKSDYDDTGASSHSATIGFSLNWGFFAIDVFDDGGGGGGATGKSNPMMGPFGGPLSGVIS